VRARVRPAGESGCGVSGFGGSSLASFGQNALQQGDQLRALARGKIAHYPLLVPGDLALERAQIAGPRSFRGTEVGVAALVDAGFDRAEAARAFRVIFLYVFGFVAFSDPDPEVTDERRRAQAAIAAELPREDFPHLSEMGGEMAETMGGDAQFEHGLDVVLDGIAARMQR